MVQLSDMGSSGALSSQLSAVTLKQMEEGEGGKGFVARIVSSDADYLRVELATAKYRLKNV